MNLDEKQIAYLKGYAMAIQDVMMNITGENTICKHYDPLEVDNKYLHSYAFDLKDGGRHHPLEDYNYIEEITECMLNEGVEWIKENNQNK